MSLLVELRDGICEERQMVTSFDGRAFQYLRHTSCEVNPARITLLIPRAFSCSSRSVPMKASKHAMVAHNNVAVSGAEAAHRTHRQNHLPQKTRFCMATCKSRVNAFEIVKAVFVQPMRSVNDLKTRSADSSQEPVQVWDEMNSLQLTFNVVVNFASLRKEIVEGGQSRQAPKYRSDRFLCSYAFTEVGENSEAKKPTEIEILFNREQSQRTRN